MTAPLSDDEIQAVLAEVLLSDWFDGYGAADAAAALLPAVRDIAAREARAKVQRVEELHSDTRHRGICVECSDDIAVGWPCATIEALKEKP
jgi:hypothetical protein